ncbi:MAG: hypothetical protein ACRENC_05620, partial [Gemmatimonadaceae bacterium]
NKPKAPRRPAARHPAHARRQGLRNASRPPSARGARAATQTGSDGKPPPQEPSYFERTGYTALGIGGASLAGALAARWGFHPWWVAAGATGAGALLMARYNTGNKKAQAAAAGAFGAGGSQLVLMALQRAQAQAPAQPLASKDTQPAQPAKDGMRRQLGALPPGALDAAFERARSTLTMDAEGHEYAYGHPGYPAY